MLNREKKAYRPMLEGLEARQLASVSPVRLAAPAVDHPATHAPLTVGHSPAVKGGLGSFDDTTIDSVITIQNKTANVVYFSLQWPGNAWQSYSLSPGETRLYWSYTAGQNAVISFDSSYDPGFQDQRYTLTSKDFVAGGFADLTPSQPSDGQQYYFTTNAWGTGLSFYRQSDSGSPGPTQQTFDHPGASGSYTVVTGNLFGSNGPSYRDVQQGAVGDCWLLASLAEVAARAPADIRNMFTYVGTALEGGNVVGVYNVRLFDKYGTAHYITVDTELPGGGGTYAQPVHHVLWVALAEKAYAQANGAGYVMSSHVGSDSYAALNSGYPGWALQAITGKSANDFSTRPYGLSYSWRTGKLIVIGTAQSPTSHFVVGSHAYAVVGYNPYRSLPYLVYNPWGSDPAGWVKGQSKYGLFYANAAYISRNFRLESLGWGAARPTLHVTSTTPHPDHLTTAG